MWGEVRGEEANCIRAFREAQATAVAEGRMMDVTAGQVNLDLKCPKPVACLKPVLSLSTPPTRKKQRSHPFVRRKEVLKRLARPPPRPQQLTTYRPPPPLRSNCPHKS